MAVLFTVSCNILSIHILVYQSIYAVIHSYTCLSIYAVIQYEVQSLFLHINLRITSFLLWQAKTLFPLTYVWYTAIPVYN